MNIERRFTRRDFVRGMGILSLGILTGCEIKPKKETIQEHPFGLYDIRKFNPQVQAELDQSIAEGKTFEIKGNKFVLDRWNGVLEVTKERGIFVKTSLSKIPDEVAGGNAPISGINFAINKDGSVEVLVANPNPGHDLPEAYVSQDGLNWQYIGNNRWEYVGKGKWKRISQ